MLPETILGGANPYCDVCGLLRFRVLRSAAGYYIGTQCGCGPYSRESGYYSNEEEALDALSYGVWVPRGQSKTYRELFPHEQFQR
jgi:hypothetical protein